jgi:hypothetical protein
MTPLRKHPEAKYTRLAVTIDGHQVVTSAGIHHDLLTGGPRYLDDEARVHQFDTMFELSGVCTCPVEQSRALAQCHRGISNQPFCISPAGRSLQ